MYSNYPYENLNNIRPNLMYNKDSCYIEACLDLFGESYDIGKSTIEYTSRKQFQFIMKRLLKNYNITDYNIAKIIHLLHEDIHKLELYINIQGFGYGFYDYSIINSLESIALENYTVEDLYELEYLYDFEFSDSRVQKLMKQCIKKIRNINDQNLDNKRIIYQFSNKKLKPLIMELNSYLDRQLVFMDGEIVEEYADLSSAELREIYEKLKVFLYRYTEKIFFRAYWKSANQRVLSRYR